MPTNLRPAVDRVNKNFPWLLSWNTHEACGEFLQRVCAEPECKAERVGLLSKSEGENGYTFPNGIRTSHDVIAWPNGERVDIIQSAGGHPAPGGPAWGVIPPDQWRSNNVYVDISKWPIYDSGTPHDAGPTGKCDIGFSWFCLQTALAEWPDEAKKNMEWIINECNPLCFRVMLAVEGESHMSGGNPDVWRDAGVFLNEDWDNRYKKMLDLVGGLGKQVHATIYGGRNQTPTESDRNRFHDRIIAASQGRWEAIRSFEAANEFKVNHWTAPEVRAIGRDMRAKLPAGFRLSLSSPDAAHSGSGDMSNEVVEASFEELYGGSDHAGANECTIHTMRDGGKWSDPYSYNIFMPDLPKINNEPPGPGSSAGGMYTTAADVEKDLNNTKGAGWAMYVAHSEWGVWNGHLPTEYYNGWREVKFVYDLPHMKEIAPVLKGSSTSPPKGPPPRADQLLSGQMLTPGQALKAEGFTCQVQDDANVVTYNAEGAPVWATNTSAPNAGNFVMQGDGNLVLHTADGTPLWASHTDGHPSAMCQLNPDGTLVIYADPAGDEAGTALWSSTAGLV
jgi:hypothetical protein